MADISSWKDITINDLGKVVTGKTPSTSISEYFGGDIPFVTPTDMNDRRFISNTERYLTQQGVEAVKNSQISAGTVMVSCIGSQMGKVAIAGKLCVTNQQINSIIVSPKYSELFVYYVLSLREDEIRSIGSGSAVPILNKTDFSNLPIAIPSLSEQCAIAGILGTLDDKIEVNRRMNATLESMARAVFRETTKNEDRKWNTGSILEFANLLSGGTPSTSEASYWNGNIEWVSAKDVGNIDSIFLLDTEKKITQKGVDNSSTKLLPAKTTIVTARGTVGAHCMLGKAMTMNQTNYGLKAKEGIGDYFVYFTLSEMVEQLKQQSYGTIFDTITTKTFQSAQCVQLPKEAIRKFESQVTPLMNMILNNQEESRTLASLRDSLLPKLMRGEVRVRKPDLTGFSVARDDRTSANGKGHG